MTFSFSFDVSQEDLDPDFEDTSELLKNLQITPGASLNRIPYQEIPLKELVRPFKPLGIINAVLPRLIYDFPQLSSLPPLLSYTPLYSSEGVKISANRPSLLRRDLFDARFQVISEDSARPEHGVETDDFVDETSDLVEGIYEGGLKTWECTLDLIDYLEATNLPVRGSSTLEIGCGTAMPTCSVFSKLTREIIEYEAKTEQSLRTRLHVQDYNKQVLSLITLPNILLTFVQVYQPHCLSKIEGGEDVDSGEIEVTSELVTSFEAFLLDNNIDLRFYAGDWSGMSIEKLDRYDLVMTSETVYSLNSLDNLIRVLQQASHSANEPALEGEPSRETFCLVACKRVYFGVGGGEIEFRKKAEALGACVKTAWISDEGDFKSSGVKRIIMRAIWNS